MPSTPLLNLPYPSLSDAPDIPYWMQQLAEAVETALDPGAWSAYTPALSGLTLGNGTLTAAYHQLGKTISLRCNFTAGSTTTFSSTLLIGLPAPPHAAYQSGHALGAAFFYDSSAGTPSRTAGSVCFDATSGAAFFVTARDTGATVTSGAPWTWASGDQVRFSATYEAA